MQLSLFDQEHRLNFQKNLKKFNLDDAIVDLQKWGRTFDAPADIDAKIESVQTLQRDYAASGDIMHIARLVKNFDEQPFLSPLKSDFKFLFRGLNQFLYDRLDKSFNDFIVDDLHPAEVFISLEAYSEAVHSIELYIQEHGEDAYLRELQGYAWFRYGDERAAYTAFTYALFNDPLACKTKYLLPGDYVNKYVFLLNKLGREQSALLQLPFALWRDGKTYICAGNSRFESLLKGRAEDNKNAALRDPAGNIRQFNYLLYLAEMERLRSGKSQNPDRLKALREQMRAINSEMFNTYLAVLQSFRNL